MNKSTLKLAYLSLSLLASLFPFVASATVITNDNVLKAINDVRTQKELPILTSNPLLEQSAQVKAEALFEKQTFDHTYSQAPFYQEIEDAGYHYETIGENLAIDYDAVEKLITDWMNSPLHAKNITFKQFDETGIAVKAGRMNGVDTILVVQHFGQSADELAVADSVLNNVMQSPYLGIAGIIATTATIEIGTMLSLMSYRVRTKVKSLRKK